MEISSDETFLTIKKVNTLTSNFNLIDQKLTNSIHIKIRMNKIGIKV